MSKKYIVMNKVDSDGDFYYENQVVKQAICNNEAEIEAFITSIMKSISETIRTSREGLKKDVLQYVNKWLKQKRFECPYKDFGNQSISFDVLYVEEVVENGVTIFKETKGDLC